MSILKDNEIQGVGSEVQLSSTQRHPSFSFPGLIPQGFVATVNKENQFSLSQITEDTLLVFIDEWSSDFLDEDILKRLLQGNFRNCPLSPVTLLCFFSLDRDF